MRRQLKLDDYDIPPLSLNLMLQLTGGKTSISTITQQLKMKDIKIDTVIRNSDKTEIGVQISQTLLLKEREIANKKQHQDHPQHQQQQSSEEEIKKVEKFLRKITPLMQKELQENLPIYNRYGQDNNRANFKRDSRLTHTLENLEVITDEKLEISSVSWNATGAIVAAAYAKFQHDSTCSHKSMICLWGLFKRNFKPNKPEIIQTPNCVNCIEFHPKKPSILVCGTYLGEVLLYDFSKKDEQLFARTIIDEYFHRDLITKVSWWAFRPPGKAETNYNILSLGSDGKILLWQVPNQSISSNQENKSKVLLKHPIKGFLMLRKKQGNVVPVSGLTMNQSKINKNIFIVGSEGGSILRAILSPINHHMNAEAKVLLDIQQSVKFKPQVYPFLLNLLPKNLRQIKSHVQKICLLNKIDQVDSVATILGCKPEMKIVYPNPITFAYQGMAYPISSISDNKYGLVIVNGCDGYSRLYAEKEKQSLESIEEGYEWGWINSGSKMAGFMDQNFVVVDWLTGDVLWSVGVGEGLSWKESSTNLIAVICDKTKIKIIELGDKIFEEGESERQMIVSKIEELCPIEDTK